MTSPTSAAGIIKNFIQGAQKAGRPANYGRLKTELNKKVREGTATKAEKEALKKLNKMDAEATISQKISEARTKGKKKPVSLAGSEKVGGTQTKLQRGLASVKDTPTPKVEKLTKKPMSAEKKRRIEEAKKKGPGALMREGLSDITGKKAAGGKMKSKGYAAGGKMKSKGYSAGGKMTKKKMRNKPRGVGVALRGYGKAMK